MTTSSQIAKHLKEVHFGGNWTSSNLKDQLEGLSWEHATKTVFSLNSIASLVFHINYYVCAVTRVLEGKELAANDKYSFDLPPITGAEDWKLLKQKVLADAEHLSSLMEKLDDSLLPSSFSDPKYGSYFRNLIGIIEHMHYHLGQIALIKQLLTTQEKG